MVYNGLGVVDAIICSHFKRMAGTLDLDLPVPVCHFISRSVFFARLALALSAFLIAASPTWSQDHPKAPNPIALTSLPIGFEPNVGQADSPVQFVAHAANLRMFLRSRGIDVLLANAKREDSRLRLDFVGANPNASLVASDEMAGYSNYILGSDPSKWLSRVPRFSRVAYKGIYPGVDAVFHGNGLELEHDFEVAPGADYRRIRIHAEGQNRLSLRTDGGLALSLPDGELVFEKPEVYQLIDGRKEIRDGHFVKHGRREFGFTVGAYDSSKPLIIDPVLVYSTYFADMSLQVAGVGTDVAGDTYVTGLVFASNFPVSGNALQSTCSSCALENPAPDVFVTKINPAGTGLIYSTYLGGNSYDQPFGIAVDVSGNAVVAGRTQSADFPVKNPVATGPAPSGSQFGFISSLSPDGSTLNFSSLVGANSTVGGVALDAAGNAYISGTTNSLAWPATPGALRLLPESYTYPVVFVSKFLTDGSLGYTSLLGDNSP